MGSCYSSDKQNSKLIEQKMKENERLEKSLMKLLFLGPGGSGKSTIFKQLQWLHGDGFQERDIMDLREHVNGQITSQMKVAIKHFLIEPVTDNTELADAIQQVDNFEAINPQMIAPEIAYCIEYIWKNDERLKDVFVKHHTRQILDDTTEYFWNNMERITAPDYVPNKQDIIHIRNRTTGIIDRKFTYRSVRFHIFDVGGQKSERKKWMKCFADVKALIFVVSLSCYNQVMFEDETKNYMTDALELFDKTINDSHFGGTPIILFLNKTDLFQKKIKDVAITECPAFDDFENKDPHDYEQTTEYVTSKFEACNQTKRTIFTHLTCAMDDQNIKSVFDDVAELIIQNITSAMQEQNIL
eukprot:142240_1